MLHQAREALSLNSLATSGDLARLQSYIRRGRGFEANGDTHLTVIWREGMRAWAKDAGTRPLPLADTEAELSLRGVEPPLALVEDEIAAVIEGAEEILAAGESSHRPGEHENAA